MSDRPSDPRESGAGPELDEALRRWAARPPATPAAEAARRLRERLAAEGPPPRRARSGLRRLAVAALLVLALGAGMLLVGRGNPVPETAPPPTAAPADPGDDVLVIDLDDETTLYMNLARADSASEPFGAGRSPEGDPS